MIMMSVAALISLVSCLLLGVPYLDFMKKKMYGQCIREEVAQLHAQKEQPPTTGGVFIVLSVLIASLIGLFMAQKTTTGALIVLMTLIFYAFTGFEDDIKKGEFYMLTDNDTLISAFSLNMQHPGEGAVTWIPGCSRAAYFGKFGVNIDYGRKGIGTMMLERAKETARSLGADRLRLFVIDYNTPAVALYEKSGFRRAEGAFFDVIDEELTLRELGYEFIL